MILKFWFWTTEYDTTIITRTITIILVGNGETTYFDSDMEFLNIVLIKLGQIELGSSPYIRPDKFLTV